MVAAFAFFADIQSTVAVLYPGIFLIIIGFVLSIIIIGTRVEMKDIHFDVHSLLYLSASFYLGYQFVSFYVFARYYGIINTCCPTRNVFGVY
jgi:hypothetical protein